MASRRKKTERSLSALKKKAIIKELRAIRKLDRNTQQTLANFSGTHRSLGALLMLIGFLGIVLYVLQYDIVYAFYLFAVIAVPYIYYRIVVSWHFLQARFGTALPAYRPGLRP